MTSEASALPLDGVTVISLEQAVAAPYATRQLADVGARVIKIERPDGGDFARQYDQSVYGQASYFVWLNRSKESLALDLKDPRGLEILDKLLENADVFVHNLGPGAVDRLGLSADALQERHPKLVICEISGYGSDGPWRDRKAYDLLVQCETGLVSVTGDGDVVAKVGISVVDIAAGMHAYGGILSVLLRRVKTGKGGVVTVSLFDALMEWLGSPMYYTMYGGRQPARVGVAHATIAPYGRYRTKDGSEIVIAVQNEREWQSMCTTVLNDPDLFLDERFSSNTARVANRADLDERIGLATGALELDEAERVLEHAGIAYARINSVAGAIDHEVLAERGRWREVATPNGPIRALVPPAAISELDVPMRAVPALGEQSAAVLAELGLSEVEIGEYERDGVIRSTARQGDKKSNS